MNRHFIPLVESLPRVLSLSSILYGPPKPVTTPTEFGSSSTIVEQIDPFEDPFVPFTLSPITKPESSMNMPEYIQDEEPPDGEEPLVPLY